LQNSFELAVVIPALDEEDTIDACLDSVGDHRCVEIVVADGGSTDGTRDLVRRRGVAIVEGAVGRGSQLNLGAVATSADRLLFLHADCRLPDGWLAAVIEALDDPRTALACFRLRTVPTGGREVAGVNRMWMALLDIRSRGLRLPYGDQGLAVRREVYEGIGGFREIPLMEDVAFSRACRRAGRIRRLPLEIRTSARRYERRPVIARLINLTFPTLFSLGVPPATLARWYREVR
jgi:rSAM/selenodomain-associated transferase 2